MKFEKGDRVKKIKGYKFTGVVVSGYEVAGGERYDVQVDGQYAINEFRYLIENGHIQVQSGTAGVAMEEMLMNCDGMIHIFSDKQLEKYG